MITRTINLTTDGSGDGTGTAEAAVGLLYAIQVIDGDLADGFDLVLTAERDSLSIPLWTKTDVNTDQMIYPRVAQTLNTDGSALTDHALPLFFGTPKAVIAQGGATKSGSVVLYIMEM
jgi:hypothetical protein